MPKINTMRTVICFLILLVSINFCTSQNSASFEPIQSKGTIPEDVLIKRSEKIKTAIEENASKKDKKRKKRAAFAASSAFSIHQLLLSGDVLYNDMYSTYLNKIKDELLANDEELRKTITVYAVKHYVPNAFTFNNGKVFFNIGLLAYIHSEAEIAFILAHEIAHYTHKHSIKTFEKATDIIPKGYTKNKDDIFAINQFSQEQEKEADSKGLELFLKSKYKRTSALLTFEDLERTEFPLMDYKFPRELISNSKLFFNNKYELDSIIPYELTTDSMVKRLEKRVKDEEDRLKEEANEKDNKNKKKKDKSKEKNKTTVLSKSNKKTSDDEDDDEDKKDDEDDKYTFETTHPEAPLRRKILLDKMINEKVDTTYGEDFIVSTEEDFYNIKRNAIIESIRNQIILHNYEEASYYAAGLLLIDSSDLYYKKLFAKSFGSMALFSNKEWKTVHTKFNKTKGYYSDYLYMMYNMYNTDKALLITSALNYCYIQHKMYPQDDEFRSLCVSLAYKLKKDFSIDENFFKDIEISKEAYTESKPNKEVYKKKKKAKKTDDNKNGKFDNLVVASMSEYKDEKELKNIFNEAKELDESLKKLDTDNKKEFEKWIDENNVGTINKVIVYFPYFRKYKKVDITSKKLAKDEKRNEEFKEQLLDAAKIAKLDMEILDNSSLSSDDIDKLNDISRIKEYFNNVTFNDYVYKPNLVDKKILNDLRAKYKSDHILFIGAAPYRSNSYALTIYGMFLWPYLALPEFLMFGSAYDFYAVTLNLSTGEIDYKNEILMKMKDNRLMGKAVLYTFLNDIKHTKYVLNKLETTKK